MTAKKAEFRFYEELNDFLPAHRRKTSFVISFHGNPAIKDTIESLGVPHAEIDLVLVNGLSVSFSFPLRDGDRVAVYPVFESFDISTVTRLRPRPLREPRFVLDVNLGKCARFMRLLGFDCLYSNLFDDRQIVAISLEQKRIILTRDVGLLKIREVTHGYWVRSTIPHQQVLEIIERCDLQNRINPFSRCMVCNGMVCKVDKNDIIEMLLPETRKYFHEFFRCQVCHKIYWKGSHYRKMKKLVASMFPNRGTAIRDGL